MSSTFSGLSTALSALYAQRHGMDTTGQNVANANTEGYTRQRVDMVPRGGAEVSAIHAKWDGPGVGVRVDDIKRLRDGFLESRGREEHAMNTFQNTKMSAYNRIENVFSEPSDTAMASQLADLWAGWGDVANRPGDTAAREQLLQRAAVAADGLRDGFSALSSQWGTARVQADSLVTEINNAADAVAKLNEVISQAQASGMPSNEMRDQRDLRLMDLAKLAGVSVVHRENGYTDVFLGGSTLVGGTTTRHIEILGGNRLEDQGADPVRLAWTDNGLPASAGSGSVGANLDLLNNIVPDLAGKLDAVAVSLATEVNNVHRAGFGLDGVNNRDMFVDITGVTGITARTIGVGITDPTHLAASSVAGTLDGSNAAALGNLGRLTNGPDAKYRSMVVGLGVEAQTSQRRAGIQATITNDMDALRFADAGVNLDEEMTNLIGYQKAYEAAARLMTSIDEALDVLINRTGIVGR
ncbi:flagellar hook-associated protein FlgK [Pilimelia columellifera]|uniref:Flagellar hook-associated protein 1 n=1 Tax=Pilimelia columellifera subsp. columellifera TaxID=706583 RepID=A0ABN3N8L7_9ACTN